jgi:TRAP-type mannitol/chloroaromatic compound transport system permease small subunit
MTPPPKRLRRLPPGGDAGGAAEPDPRRPLDLAIRGVEGLIDGIGRLAMVLTLVMIGLVASNVLLRYAFSFGSVWAQELEWHLLAAVILFGMAYALQRGDSVRVDLFYARYSPRSRFIVDLVSALLLLLISAIFVKLSVSYVQQSWVINEGSPDPGGIPWRWAVKGLIPLGFGLLFLQQLAALLRLLLKLPAPKEAGHV